MSKSVLLMRIGGRDFPFTPPTRLNNATTSVPNATNTTILSVVSGDRLWLHQLAVYSSVATVLQFKLGTRFFMSKSVPATTYTIIDLPAFGVLGELGEDLIVYQSSGSAINVSHIAIYDIFTFTS